MSSQNLQTTSGLCRLSTKYFPIVDHAKSSVPIYSCIEFFQKFFDLKELYQLTKSEASSCNDLRELFLFIKSINP